jgi:hypothetical protein
MAQPLHPVVLPDEDNIRLENNQLPRADTCDPYTQKDPYIRKPFTTPPELPDEGVFDSIDLTRLKRKASKKFTVPFWAEDPNVLLQQPYTLEFFPVGSMTFNQKLNAITRTVIVLTIITFALNKNTRILAVSALTILAIFLLYYANKTQKKSGEGFLGAGYMSPDTNVPAMGPQHHRKNRDELPPHGDFADTFQVPDPQNPMANVLLPDYDYNPNKKPAPPAYTKNGSDKILEEAKRMVVEANPGQPDIAKKLFGDLGDELDFEQSMRPFYSTANTTIPNDQGGFAEFCYGGMVSCKEGNMFACARDNPRYDLY